jgi:hypothetical protein
VTFPEDGTDDDLRDACLERQVTSRRERADELIATSKAIIDGEPNNSHWAAAERDARAALMEYASALNWAEDSPGEESAHINLDAAGRWVRQTFGCSLAQDGTRYRQECPVAVGHNRVGLSVGGVAKRICSLCGGDLSECEHQRGVAYLVPGGTEDLGWCRVCREKEKCDHQPDQQYRVGVVSMIMEMELFEVSLVSKPAHPDARIRSLDVPLAELERRLGSAFVPGMGVSCDRCLSPCGGLTRHDWIHG